MTISVVAAVLGYEPWQSSTWARWDSGLYEDIARDGYDLFPCREEPEKWCGDAGWFPAYAWLIGGLHVLGAPLGATAALVSWLAAAGTLVLLWATFLDHRSDAAVVAALAYGAFAPGQIYHYAVFPLSLLSLATVACLWWVWQGRYVLGGIAGAIAAVAYPAGLLLAPVSAAWLLLQSRTPLAERFRRVALTSGLMLAGAWIFLIDQRLETGRWDAYLLVQKKYEHEWQDPLDATWEMLIGGDSGWDRAFDVAVALQTALVTGLLLLVLLRTIVRRVRIDSPDWLLLIWALATWTLPLSQTAVSAQRSQATLLPIAVLVARLPKRTAWALAITAAGLAVWMEHYFLDGTLF